MLSSGEQSTITREPQPRCVFVLSSAAVAVLSITLSLGLWPFYSPRNDVHWLSGTDGLIFGRHGTVFGPEDSFASLRSSATTVEIWVQPNRWATSATILTLYDAHEKALFEANQSLADIEVVTKIPGEGRRRQLYIEDGFGPALRRGEAVLLTITDAPGGTAAYVNGTLAKRWSDRAIPPEASTGRLIIGDSPGQSNSFSGKVFGLAIYGIDLNPAEIQQHYLAWVANHRPEIRAEGITQALYLFNERRGSTIHDRASVRGDLHIPSTYQVLDRIRLRPFWQEFEWSYSYWSGNLKNVVGFVPAGFVFCAYFQIVRRVRRPVVATVIAGIVVSFSIEVIQGFLPTRDSGTTDLFTNGFGTTLGAAWFHYMYTNIFAKIARTVVGSMQN